MCMWFWYNTFIYFFFSLFLLCELSLCFLHKMLSKCIDSGYLLFQFRTNCFETLQMFSALNEDVHVVLV